MGVLSVINFLEVFAVFAMSAGIARAFRRRINGTRAFGSEAAITRTLCEAWRSLFFEDLITPEWAA